MAALDKLDKEMCVLFTQQHSQGGPVSGTIINNKSFKINQKLNSDLNF